MTVTLTETLPLEDQAPSTNEGVHWICLRCFPDPQFGEVVIAICGKEKLFDEWRNDATLDCPECLKVGYDPCFMCGK